MHKSNALVLLSGGMDSACLLPYYLGKKFNLTCLWVNYNQLGKEYEEKAVDHLCNTYKINLIKLKLDKNIVVVNSDNMEYLGRNLLLASLALSEYPYKQGLISTGIRYSSNYNDCGERFVLDLSNLIENLSNGLILLDIPFYNFSKKDIVLFAEKHCIDINSTYSCIRGHPGGCMNCVSCREREKALGR